MQFLMSFTNRVDLTWLWSAAGMACMRSRVSFCPDLCRALLVSVTMRADAIGTMSCNPAIGGIGEGPAACARSMRWTV